MDPVAYLELRYKRRVYRMVNVDEKQIKQLHTRVRAPYLKSMSRYSFSGSNFCKEKYNVPINPLSRLPLMSHNYSTIQY